MNKFKVKGEFVVKTCFFAGLFLMPLIYWPLARVPYEIPKVWFFQRWVELLTILSIIFFRSFSPRQIDTRLFVLILFFLFSAILSSLIGADFTRSLYGNYYRMDGLLTSFHLVGFTLILFLIWDKSFETGMAVAICLSNFILALLVLINPVFFNIWPDGGRGATFGNPNFLAGYLVCTLPFTLFLFNKFKKLRFRIFFVLSFCLQIVSIYLTKSTGGFLGAAFFFFICLAMFFYKNIKFKKIGLVVAFVIFLTIIIFVLRNIWAFEHSIVYDAEARSRILPKIFLGALTRPLFGWGVSNVDRAFEEVPYPYPFRFDIYVDKAHSTFLEIFATQGIIGLLIYLLIIFRVFFLFKKRIRRENSSIDFQKTILFVFILFIFHSQTNIISINEEMLFWMIVGVVGIN